MAFAADRTNSAAGVLSTWDWSPETSIPAALALAVYARGLARRPGSVDVKPWRHLAFIWGVIATFLSLASPLDALADHLFFVHQVQHMLIRVVGPMLIAFSQPQGVLIAGLPSSVRRWVVAPLAASRLVRSVFSGLAKPAVATSVFIGILYLWQWPLLHNLALRYDGIHDLMHFTMLVAGLAFFWRVFDHRPPPKGARYGVRLMMVWLAVLANIPIGAYTTFKNQELYPAYGAVTRLFGMSAMDGERLGGFIMWAPSSMMMLVAVIFVIQAWGGNEERITESVIGAPRQLRQRRSGRVKTERWLLDLAASPCVCSQRPLPSACSRPTHRKA